MEIKNISGIVNVYNKIKLNSGKTKVAPAEKKTDKIEFNFARSVEAAKADLAAAVNEIHRRSVSRHFQTALQAAAMM